MIFKFRHSFSSVITTKVLKAVNFSLGSRYSKTHIQCRALKRDMFSCWHLSENWEPGRLLSQWSALLLLKFHWPSLDHWPQLSSKLGRKGNWTLLSGDTASAFCLKAPVPCYCRINSTEHIKIRCLRVSESASLLCEVFKWHQIILWGSTNVLLKGTVQTFAHSVG